MLKTKHMNTLLTTLCSHLDLKPEHTELLDERDTSDVWRQFAIWLLVDEEHGVIRLTRRGSQMHRVIQQVADLYIQNCKDTESWKAAQDAADDVDAYEAYAAFYAAHAYASDSAAKSAAKSAFYAAKSSIYAYTYKFNYIYDVTDSEVAESAYNERMANKLIELLQAAPLKENP